MPPRPIPLFAEVQIDRSVAPSSPWRCHCALRSSLASFPRGRRPPPRSGDGTQRVDITPRTQGLRHVLVAAEVALSIVLVVGAVLLVRSLGASGDGRSRFQPGTCDDVHDDAAISALPRCCRPPLPRVRRYRTTTERSARRPGRRRQQHARAAWLYLGGDTTHRRPQPRRTTNAIPRHMSNDTRLFQRDGGSAAGRPVVHGGDARENPPVTIVNQSLARRYFSGTALADRRRQESHLRTASGQRSVGDDRRRRRGRETGRAGPAGRTDRISQHRTAASRTR